MNAKRGLFKLIMSLFTLFIIQFARADEYDFLVTDPNPTNLIQIKNCLDYSFCTGRGTGLVGDGKQYQFHTFIELATKADLDFALKQCNLNKLALNITIQNITTKKNVLIPVVESLVVSKALLIYENPSLI